MSFIRTFYVMVFFISGTLIHAQNKPEEKDSTNIYNKIEKFSEKGKVTKTLHSFLFRSQKENDKPVTDLPERPNLKKYNNKIIRNINIITFDPFGKKLSDTTQTVDNWLERTGNFLHVKTKDWTVKNLLLFKENQVLDSLLLTESERLIRTNNYVREALITPELVSNDSVDVTVMVLDSWSLIPNASISTSKNTLKLKERNLLGFGHNYKINYTTRFEDGEKAYDIAYNIPNFKNTYINTSINYYQDLDKNYRKSIDINRPFYSPLTKWAGGVTFSEQYSQIFLPNSMDSLSIQDLKFYTQDVWLGYSYKIFKGSSVKERTTNLVTSLRYINTDYKERPDIAYDSIRYFSSESFPIASIGLSSRQYIQDEYLLNYGIIEDVPVGTIYSLTGGYEYKNQRYRTYLGARVSMGNYTKLGYLSFNLEYGTYIRGKTREQTTYVLEGYYFSDLVSLGDKWKLRQFIKPQIIIGSKRLGTVADRISLNENKSFQGLYASAYERNNASGLPDFDSSLYGTEKFVISLQTQVYSPWNLLGFRLNPYINITSGLIGDENNRFYENKLYNAFSLGFLIRNDYLVFNSFQISFTYYPSIPNEGSNIFKTNTLETDDLGFPDFELGKPRPVLFN
ncbi:BamA/TamA family outer membrane protein [Hanstruepera ponticola]|uniref:hypothetical protein n=1 Tax=Hanstruepera ponticola TaxID=2042995 RepID=UPI001E654A12|nr:hypothetical protein [Hanstruepera ponticola]